MAALWVLEPVDVEGRGRNDRARHSLQAGSYSVGRGGADLELPDDKSVSRSVSTSQ